MLPPASCSLFSLLVLFALGFMVFLVGIDTDMVMFSGV